MKTIKVELAERSYKIVIGSGIIGSLGRYIKRLNIGTDAYIITNSLIKRKYGHTLLMALHRYGINSRFGIIADSERSKTLTTCLRIIQDLAYFDKRKKVFIIAFGGGVVGDLGGFIASIYRRGLPYIQLPTTLLACVDSSIGGKTGVDLKFGKNLVGSFYQPRLVMSELSFLNSLSKRQIRAGLAEVIKYAIIKDKGLFAFLEKKHTFILRLDETSLEFIVKRCAEIKAKIVQQDEKEKRGIRTILNFGHTLGHAIEAASDYRGYNHGEAIALGMVLASKISNKIGLIDRNNFMKIEKLIRTVGLPTSIKGLSLRKIIAAYYYDKKFIGGLSRIVLIRSIGKTAIKNNLPLKLIKGSLNERMNPQT